MISTKDSGKLAENVVTDVNANVPLPVEASRSISPDTAILFNKSIVARPLMTPEVCAIKVKNTDYRYRWVNRDGQGGRIYMQRKAQGFLNATTADVEILGGDAEARDGEIRAGDLVLMKIQADRYDAALKYNMQEAYRKARMRGVFMEGASSDVMSDAQPRRVSVSEEPFSKLTKPFIPENADQIISESIKSGRVEETRATNSKLGKV